MESDWAERTIVVSGFPKDVFPITVMIDKLTIHFLRPKNGGGEVENVVYPTDIAGVAYVTFEKKEVVNSVLRQDRQVFEDKQLPEKYPLKISQNNLDVFSAVSVDLDCSRFENSLEIRSILREFESNNKFLQFSMRHNGRLHIIGSFPALKELRKELHKKISELQGINVQDSAMKSGISDSEGKSVKSLHNHATCMIDPQRFTAPPSYGDKDVLDPGVFQEESTIILDADIFLYIVEICKTTYEGILRNHHVTAKPINNNNIIFLQLFETSESRKPSELKLAKYEMQMFISQMQNHLVIDRIRLDGDRLKDKTLRICKTIMQHFNVLVRFGDDCVTLIGGQDDCKWFMRQVEETMQTDFYPASGGCPSSLRLTEGMHQFAQSMGSDTAHTLHMPSPTENTLKSNCDGYTMSQIDRCPPYSSSDSHGKQGSSPDCVGALVSGLWSLPPLPHASLNVTEERESKTFPRSDRPPSRMQY
ncbi:RNA-binding protein 43-like [Pristis pectinata]|uniref:RNA-binding protein 43-like n=1 Tax=Pristis pectinata TaxID=685728 RepID=UPI00223CC59E|nr:RNA-binding protein 43-like [Pristis pectinata]XP_051874710.1 RNA-binding protein 43-like [Pristis pectinata]